MHENSAQTTAEQRTKYLITVPVNCDPDLQTWSRQGQGKSACHKGGTVA